MLSRDRGVFLIRLTDGRRRTSIARVSTDARKGGRRAEEVCRLEHQRDDPALRYEWMVEEGGADSVRVEGAGQTVRLINLSVRDRSCVKRAQLLARQDEGARRSQGLGGSRAVRAVEEKPGRLRGASLPNL